jgi:DNA repair exonuclease SbcCD ATPase subunit
MCFVDFFLFYHLCFFLLVFSPCLFLVFLCSSISHSCRNRIALIQKEEERARKKIQETKERAAEIISLRNENEKRVQAYVNASGEVRQLQQVLIAKNREQDTEGKKARLQRLEVLHSRRKEEVHEMLQEKKYLTQIMLQEQSREIQLKQQKREQVKKMEEEQRMKKEQERREKERKMKEMYQKKLLEEAQEAKRAEKLVRLLEKKEKQWIQKLKSAQTVQDTAFEQLETALSTAVPKISSQSRVSPGRDEEKDGRMSVSASRSTITPHSKSSKRISKSRSKSPNFDSESKENNNHSEGFSPT